MALYSYKAIDARGRSRIGEIEALNLDDLEQRLARMGLDLVVGGPTRRRARRFHGAIGRPDLINFCFHLEQLTTAGVPILESLADLRDSVDHPRLREVISGLIENIQGGQNLSAAMARHKDVFPPVFASLIRAGEETGSLSLILNRLADNLKWEDELIAQTKRLLAYPAFVGAIVLAVSAFLMLYLVPQMTGFIQGTGQTIPLQTRILIRVSDFFVAYWWAALLVPAAAIAGTGLALARSAGLRHRYDALKLRLPLVGPMLRKIVLSRFANTFAMMYAAGITILDCIKSAEDVVGNLAIREALARAGRQIAAGRNVSAAFQNAGLFPPLVIRMLRVGESSGRLDEALANVSYFYDRDVREGIGKVQAMIEPAMTVILGALLGWVMLSVLGPIYDSIARIRF